MKPLTTATKLLASCLLLGFASTTLADLAGNVVRVKGSAAIVSAGGDTRPLETGSIVNEGDTVKVSEGSAVQLQMKDGALIALSSQSQLKISTYNFEEPNGDPDGVKMELKKGRLRTITGGVPQDAYNMTTPLAIVRIKGTTYDLLSNDDTTAILRDGAITIESTCEGQGTGDIQLLDIPGMAAAVTAPCTEPLDPYAYEGDTSDLQLLDPPDEPKAPEGCTTDCDPPSSSSP